MFVAIGFAFEVRKVGPRLTCLDLDYDEVAVGSELRPMVNELAVNNDDAKLMGYLIFVILLNLNFGSCF